MRVQNAAVIGHPIGHTMSPFIHQRLFALEGIPVSCQVLDVPDLPAALPAAVSRAGAVPAVSAPVPASLAG